MGEHLSHGGRERSLLLSKHSEEESTKSQREMPLTTEPSGS